MTALMFDSDGVEVLYQGTEFRLERAMIEEAVGKTYFQVTDHEVRQLVDGAPSLQGEPRQISDILG
jgi:hypothetical protein